MPLKKKFPGTPVTRNYHQDFISNLPQSLRVTILNYLPLRDAVKTSVLSSEWRYMWTKVPHLCFDELILEFPSGGDQLEFQNKCVRQILRVLLQHEGPITTFVLAIPELEFFPEMDSLMFFLAKSDVEDLTLEFEPGHNKLPSTFFKCQRLKAISLLSCLVHPPSDFIGFSQLLTILMLDVAIGSEQLQSFVACCPLLKSLHLRISSVYEALEIQASKLENFEFHSKLKSVSFKNTPLLKEVVIINHSDIEVEEKNALHGKSNLIEFFRSIPSLSVLHIDTHFIQFLAANGVLKRPSLTAVHLNTLILEGICLEKTEEMTCVLLMVRISPNLQCIMIRLCNCTGVAGQNPSLDSLDVEEFSDVKLDQLKRVELKYFTGTRNQMALAKLLLIKSPRLRKMIIKPHAKSCDEKQGFRILKKLIRLHRSSAAAKIIYG
ncbi:unnamed protein product [Cuscuta epithymum]|uniref:F-box domain-containing protein n=1 Tax=Cuscuta epithymum TaxID=186058 RepID=A0AAV0GIQ4_9ASTE|nr:unnamed protein product [Cuscuta epithymum]